MKFTQEYLREAFTYVPETGICIWNNRPREHFNTDRGWKVFNSSFAGKVIGCERKGTRSTPYLEIRINNTTHLLHRLICIWVKGRVPEMVDHDDGNSLNNAWANINYSDATGNNRNLPTPSNNTSGHIGVNLEKGKWKASISSLNKKLHLGTFKTFEEAVVARKQAEKDLGYNKNHGRTNGV